MRLTKESAAAKGRQRVERSVASTPWRAQRREHNVASAAWRAQRDLLITLKSALWVSLYSPLEAS